VLPAGVNPGLAPSGVSVNQDAFVRNGGVYPTTKPENPRFHFGSYTNSGDLSTGEIRLDFPATQSVAAFQVLVAGYPRSEGMGLFLVTPDGKQKPIQVRENPKETWYKVVIKNPGEPFSILAVDGSPKTWLAIGLPVHIGPISLWVRWILENWWIFGALGMGCFIWGGYSAVLAKHNLRSTITLVSLIAILLQVFIHIDSIGYNYSQPDEIIAEKVVEGIIKNKNYDSNWKQADLPSYFKYPQYNFSSYMIFCAVLSNLFHSPSDEGIISIKAFLRILNIPLFMLLIILTYLAGRLLTGHFTGLGAAVFCAYSPLLFQDSLYARPETFFTTLSILFICTLLIPNLKLNIKIALSSTIFGILLATKISAVLMFPLFVLIFDNKLKINKNIFSFFNLMCSCAPQFILFIIAGVFIGAPSLLFNLSDFVYGFKALSNQYTSGHWPHGISDATMLSQLLYSLQYFTSTHGFLFIVSTLCGLAGAILSKNRAAIIVFSVAVLTFIRFSTYPVFFERNISHFLPIFFIFSAYGIIFIAKTFFKQESTRILIAVIMFLLLVSNSFLSKNTIYDIQLKGKHSELVSVARKRHERKLNVQTFNPGWVKDYDQLTPILENTRGPLLLEFMHPNDQYSLKTLNKLKEVGFLEIDSIKSPFHSVPACTLHTYFTPNTIFLYKSM
jgi:hypothetical protein